VQSVLTIGLRIPYSSCCRIGSRLLSLRAQRDLPQGFRTRNYVRDWLPIRREQCAKRVSRKSRWSRSSSRLKKLVAERDLEIEIMKEVAAKNW
jgi:hypothetical protein